MPAVALQTALGTQGAGSPHIRHRFRRDRRRDVGRHRARVCRGVRGARSRDYDGSPMATSAWRCPPARIASGCRRRRFGPSTAAAGRRGFHRRSGGRRIRLHHRRLRRGPAAAAGGDRADHHRSHAAQGRRRRRGTAHRDYQRIADFPMYKATSDDKRYVNATADAARYHRNVGTECWHRIRRSDHGLATPAPRGRPRQRGPTRSRRRTKKRRQRHLTDTREQRRRRSRLRTSRSTRARTAIATGQQRACRLTTPPRTTRPRCANGATRSSTAETAGPRRPPESSPRDEPRSDTERQPPRHRFHDPRKLLILLVGGTGFEPVTTGV